VGIPLVLCIAFYVNYLYLSKYIVSSKRNVKRFAALEVLLIALCVLISQSIMQVARPTKQEEARMDQQWQAGDKVNMMQPSIRPGNPRPGMPAPKRMEGAANQPMGGPQPMGVNGQPQTDKNQHVSQGDFSHRPVFRSMHHHKRPPRVLFVFNDVMMLLLASGIGCTLRTSKNWWRADRARQRAELAQKQAELGLKESELSNLRNQINPHFLLNTLNNIYALIAFNTEKAQGAVLDLSKLLRHILYDNNSRYVSLRSEMDFLRNYVALMRIRLPETVDVTFDDQVPSNCELKVAPLLFISLVENAFKHGISPTETDNFIHINFSTDEKDHTITCDISNSNHPKTSSDKSGNGVGLVQVQRRLDLLYPNSHEWTRGVELEGRVYHSKLTIKDIES
jgi:hypothetical protein